MRKFLVAIFIVFIAILYAFSGGVGLDKSLDSIGCDYSVIDYYDDGSMTLLVASEDVENILKFLCVEVVESKEISNRYIIEGYTSCLNNYILKNGRKINLQIAISDNVLLGYPLIKNSF